MKILVTGASGFTGRHFEGEAQKAGHSILKLGADLTDSPALSGALEAIGAFDAVVHLAAISFVGHKDHLAFYAVNTLGTCNLLAALADLPSTKRPNKVLIASSANVYGNCERSPISESQVPAPMNHYAASKLAMEHLVRTFADRLPVILARPFNYTGPGQDTSFLIPKLVDHFARLAPSIELGNTHVEREFNDVRMVCDAYLRLLEHGTVGETYNVCSGKPYSLKQVIDQLSQLTGHKVEINVNPAFVRTNEVHRLCGDPTLLKQRIGDLCDYPLRDTLSNMLAEHAPK